MPWYVRKHAQCTRTMPSMMCSSQGESTGPNRGKAPLRPAESSRQSPSRRSHLAIKGASGAQPDEHDAQQDDSQVGGGGSQAAEADDHDLLDGAASALAQGVAHHVDGSLALELHARQVQSVAVLQLGCEGIRAYWQSADT